MTKLIIRILALAALFTVGSVAHAEDFAGTYRGEGWDESAIVTKTGTDQYTIKCRDWTSILFWNKETKTYEGVYRYNDKVSEASKDFGAGGEHPNAVGHHSIAPKGDGVYVVTVQWDLSAPDGRGSYEIKKMK